MATAVSDLARVLTDLPLLRPDQRLELERLPQGAPESLVQSLVQRDWLTAYQGKLLLQGRATALMLGHYVILDRLGAGGMGQVFKARHATLDRVVALKVLRPELVADAETVGRFYREIEVAGRLPEHPNLIRAFDAGPFGPTHFLAMEYVAGSDLDRLVRQSGPLPIEQACEFVRQAALGLQHAHEHKLVHRDIKPSNLLVSSGPGAGVVKILDLGLARFLGVNENCKRENALVTTDGTVSLGTVDYQAPEQALDFHRTDIRADVYSLGCTFFYLLTGKPPFGEGPLAVKLMRHQQAEPPDLQERRPDVPAGLIPIVERMLAKKPVDRYQTPGAVAAALTALQRPTRRPPVRALLAAAGGAVLLLLLLVSFFLMRSGASKTVESSNAPPSAPTHPRPPQDSLEAAAPEAEEYQLVYDLNLAKLAKVIVYDQDRSAKITQPFDRIAYFIELRRSDGPAQYLYVSMDAFTADVKKIGVPTIPSGASFQVYVANMNVYSNVSGVVAGTGITGGNIEFWPNNYTSNNAMKIPNADSKLYDFGDQMTDPRDGYGSMQVHNHDAKQTLFAVNHWVVGGQADIGIGNNPQNNPDWTFAKNAGDYRTKRLRVLVRCK